MKHTVTPILILTALLLGGCVFAPGDGRGRDDYEREAGPTIGQELLDLDRAHDAGVISDSEFERAKERILDR
ncbi:MAG: hypothetical protein RLZZ227_2341 [Pseudomonadota bacterium]|jgi:hypothetical protein